MKSTGVFRNMFYLVPLMLTSLGGSAGAQAPAAPASTLRDCLAQAHLQGRFAQYTPHFRVEEFSPGKWWVFDGKVQVGLVVREYDFAELDNFDPYHPLPNAPFPKIYHAPTMLGDRITLATAMLPKADKVDYKFDVTPEQATLRMTVNWDNGNYREKTVTWKVDPDFGYIIHSEDELHSAQFGKQEYCNFLPRGTTDDRLEFRRYSYVLWEHPNGKTLRWNQNNMGARLPGNKDINGQRLIKTGSFIGYFGEKDRSPALEILESSPITHSDTCTNLLDEHITWGIGDPAQAAKDQGGRFISRAVFNLVSLPPELSVMLTQRARMIDLYMPKSPEEKVNIPTYWGFTQGVPVDFENKTGPEDVFRGVLFYYPEDANEPISVVSDGGHSGTHSLRMRATGGPLRFLMDGGSVHVTEGKHYRLTAWIKTDLTDGQAVLKADEALFTNNNFTAKHQGKPITGKNDWQEITLDFTPGEKAHIVIMYVEVTGHGTVWVDDFLLRPYSDLDR